MPRPMTRLVLVGVATAAVLLGATVRADATGRHAKQPEHMLAARTEAPLAAEATLPNGFQESTVFSGLTFPTNFRFSPDGRVFVAEKSGKIEVFDNLDDSTPTLFADLRQEVDDYWDRGLLGLALDPGFPAVPYVYVLYTYDAPPGKTAPIWHDACPTPPGPTTDGCVVTGRLSRLTVDEATGTAGTEDVLLEGWCQQYPSHSVGDLRFGLDGALYVSGGEGSNFVNADDGQWGGTLPNSTNPVTPKNPCDDPPAGIGHDEASPTAEGGALRSLSLHRVAGPALLSGTVLRVDSATGDAMPDNPLAASSDAVARKIVAEGLRNPFRFALRPGTDDLWVGDVGWNDWEEINRNPTPKTTVANFGWPCYEGDDRQPTYESFLLNICTGLYDLEGSDDPSEARSPYFTYNHDDSVVAGDGCTTGSSSVTGLAFYESGTYPSSYAGALFFADHSRNCVWVMPEGSDGVPDPSQISEFLSPAAGPVDLEIGPGGDLFYAGFDDGTIRRVQYFSGNQPPIAVATATPQNGTAPLEVQFDASGSHDPDPGDTLSYSWDLDGDGTFGDATGPGAVATYNTPGTHTVRLQVTDGDGATNVATVEFRVNRPPVASFTVSPLNPAAGAVVRFTSTSTDPDGAQDIVAQDWDLDGDGRYTDASGPSASATFAPGAHSVGLRVTDSGGVTSFAEESVTVPGAGGAGGAGSPAGTASASAGHGSATGGSAGVAGSVKNRTLPVLDGVRVQIAGTVSSIGTRITRLVVIAPRGALVTASCRGGKCRLRRVRLRVRQSPLHVRRFEQSLRSGARITVVVSRSGFISRPAVFTIRRGRPPLRRDLCQAPGARTPTRCPAT